MITSNVKIDDMYKVQSFEYNNVTLKHSHWRNQLEETIEFYLAIPDDDLLHIFRKRAGIPSDAQGLAGWYGTNANTFGQKLGAFAKLYRVTGDFRLKEKSLYLFGEWAKCVDKEPTLLNQGTYVYEKLIGGLLDIYEYIGYEKTAIYILKLTERAMINFNRNIKRDGLQDREIWSQNMIEWYTLPENLYRAYELIGNEKFRDFAKVWDYDYLWNKLINKDFSIGPRHAYSHVNSLSSGARSYKITKDDKYLVAMKNAYDEITNNHIFATGGYGPAESIFVDRNGYLGNSLKSTWDETLSDPMYTNFGGGKVTRNDTWGSCEVSCCAWAVFKFCNYLIRLTGDAKYGDWVEKMLYNGTGAQLPVALGGKVMYYANYFIDGGLKTVEDRRLQPGGYGFMWQCCTGTFPQDVAEYANMLYYFDVDSIYVSQYLPSKVDWMKDNVKIGVENYSKYPEESRLKFRVTAEKDMDFNFRFRVPSWANGKNSIMVNGQKLNIELKPNSWASVTRVWKDGDLISIDFPFSLYFKSVDHENSNIIALNYGPIVLVANEMTEFIGDPDRVEEWIHSAQGENMTFETDKGHVAGYDFLTRTFVPYYKFGAMQWYYMYNKIK